MRILWLQFTCMMHQVAVGLAVHVKRGGSDLELLGVSEETAKA